jgi:hypothetical protein
VFVLSKGPKLNYYSHWELNPLMVTPEKIPTQKKGKGKGKKKGRQEEVQEGTEENVAENEADPNGFLQDNCCMFFFVVVCFCFLFILKKRQPHGYSPISPHASTS